MEKKLDRIEVKIDRIESKLDSNSERISKLEASAAWVKLSIMFLFSAAGSLLLLFLDLGK